MDKITLGPNNFGQNVFGQNTFGQNVFGQTVFGQNVLLPSRGGHSDPLDNKRYKNTLVHKTRDKALSITELIKSKTLTAIGTDSEMSIDLI